MNEFEKQFNALRIQFRNERVSIQKDADRTIGRLNNAIGQVRTPEAREALRAEKKRVYEATRQSMRDNRLCFRLQLDLLEGRHSRYLERHPSKRRIRSLLATLCTSAEADGHDSLSITFGKNRTEKSLSNNHYIPSSLTAPETFLVFGALFRASSGIFIQLFIDSAYFHSFSPVRPLPPLHPTPFILSKIFVTL